ncbi:MULTISPECIES: hypothetical protein [unclassified Leifsonia]|uniref:hypothetical protein n=1 Tax=unclassified Leifsonia TaxID=2663824 RepID=UPI000B7EC8C6|nr:MULTISPECIES: hypothetical protein [unclassified Leifsonia]
MKSALVLSEDMNLFEHFAALITANGGVRSEDGVAQLVDPQGRMLTLFHLESDNDLTLPPTRVVGMSPPASLTSLAVCSVECRWEAMVVYWVRRVAIETTSEVWLLDSDGVLWSSEAVDATALRL